MMKIRFRKIIFWMILILVFFSLSGYSVLQAAGYRINWQGHTIQKIGMIVLRGKDADVKIYLNDLQVGKGLPFQINDLFPGWYRVIITKPGCHNWQASYWVGAGEFKEAKNIILWSKNTQPVTSTLADDRTLINNTNLPSDIHISNNELWVGDQLINRFSQKIQFANWYPDKYHVIFQIGKEIRVVEKSGTNDTLLTTLSADEISKFTVINNKILLYQDGSQLERLMIR